LLAEWHMPPDHIVSNWTDELLNLMIEKLVERKQREIDSIKGVKCESDSVSPEMLASVSHGTIKVVKHGD